MLGCCSNVTYIRYSVKTIRVDGYIKDTIGVSARTFFDCRCLICTWLHFKFSLAPTLTLVSIPESNINNLY